MHDEDKRAIKALGDHFSPKKTKKFEPRELDEKVWEEGLRLGYSEGPDTEVEPPREETIGIENERDIVFHFPIRGIFEGNFIPLNDREL